MFYLLADISSGAIFALLPSNAIFLGLSMYKMEYVSSSQVIVLFHNYSSLLIFYFIPKTSSAELDLFNISFDMFNLLCSLLWPYLFCYCATNITNRIPSLGYVAYDSNWYDYPPELRGHITLIIRRSQEPIQFTGFKIVGCNFEVFGNVCISDTTIGFK